MTQTPELEDGVHRDLAIDPEQVVRGFLTALAGRMPAAEIKDVRAETPEELRGPWPA